MAEIDVKTNTSNESKSEPQSSALSKQGGRREVSRGWEPAPFALSSSDWFNPFSLMRRMSEEMERTFGGFWGHAAGGGDLFSWRPAVDVAQRDGQLHVHAELPGLKPEDVKVEATDASLVIRGERKHEQEENKGGVYRSERSYGRFYREIPLPEGASLEQAKANFNNGVLEVTLPVAEHTSSRREIPIHSSSSNGK